MKTIPPIKKQLLPDNVIVTRVTETRIYFIFTNHNDHAIKYGRQVDYTETFIER